jgi:hypothetical protein
MPGTGTTRCRVPAVPWPAKTWERPSVSVHLRPPLSVAVVTHLVIRVLAAPMPDECTVDHLGVNYSSADSIGQGWAGVGSFPACLRSLAG